MRNPSQSILGLLLILPLLAGCQMKSASTTLSGLSYASFEGQTEQGQTALYTITNQAGMEVAITNFGGRIVSVMVPDRQGVLRDVVLGFDNIRDYMLQKSDFGASIGRYANRIGNHSFTLDGQVITLLDNDGGNCLHGGPRGWQYRLYQVTRQEKDLLELTLRSEHGDMKFPGNVTVKVTFHLTEDNAIEISYEGTTDRKTVLNMTNHSYFNLSGDPATSTMDHVLYLNAEGYTPVDAKLLPLGQIEPVAGTVMDFTTPKAIGRDIESGFKQLGLAGGYDHNWVLATGGDQSKVAARLYSPASGIVLEVFTDEPGIQVYTGNFLDGKVAGKHGILYPRRSAVCLETQHFPDSPNRPEFPSVILEPGQTYHSHCTYRFSVAQ